MFVWKAPADWEPNPGLFADTALESQTEALQKSSAEPTTPSHHEPPLLLTLPAYLEPPSTATQDALNRENIEGAIGIYLTNV